MEQTAPENEVEIIRDKFPFKWGKSTFYTLDKNLQIILESPEPPKEWKNAKYIHPRRKSKLFVHEEVYVTLLSFFLEKFTGEGLSFINRSYWSTYGGVDLTSVDSIWRIHLFEVKNEKCKIKDLNQLERYFNATSFENLKIYIKEYLDNKPFSENIMKALMFGLYSGIITASTEKKTIEKSLDINIKSKDWSNHNLKAEYLAKYVQNKIYKIWGLSISEQEIRDNSKKWYEFLEYSRNNVRSRVEEGIFLKWLEPEQKSVLWLVGPDFDRDVLDGITKLRGDKRDLRLLTMEVRLSKGLNHFFVKIKKEDFPQRDELSKALSNWINEHNGNYNLRIQYYSAISPAGRKKPELGFCLNKPKAEIFDEKLKPVQWR